MSPFKTTDRNCFAGLIAALVAGVMIFAATGPASAQTSELPPAYRPPGYSPPVPKAPAKPVVVPRVFAAPSDTRQTVPVFKANSPSSRPIPQPITTAAQQQPSVAPNPNPRPNSRPAVPKVAPAAQRAASAAQQQPVSVRSTIPAAPRVRLSTTPVGRNQPSRLPNAAVADTRTVQNDPSVHETPHARTQTQIDGLVKPESQMATAGYEFQSKFPALKATRTANVAPPLQTPARKLLARPPAQLATGLERVNANADLYSTTTVPAPSTVRSTVERLPVARSTPTPIGETNDVLTVSQLNDLQLNGPQQNSSTQQFGILPPPEFESSETAIRIAEAKSPTANADKTNAAKTVPEPAANKPEQQNPTPTKSSQPTVAGGLDGYDMGYGGSGCGGCGGCRQCVSPFSPDPNYEGMRFDPTWEWDVYDGKWWNCVQQPLINWGNALYGPGPTAPSYNCFGRKNPVSPKFLLYGDYRTALAYNDNGAQDKVIWAHRLNLDFDFKWTATERLHAFWGPLDRGNFTRFEANDGELEFIDEFDDDFDTLFFEGDLGYIWGGFTDQYAPFDLPFAFGRFPLFFQNGIWFNEVIEGFAFTIPAQHLRVPTISNWEVTWFFGFDDVANPAFANDDDVANIYGMHGFFEMFEGYFESGYAFLDDQTGAGLGFHSFGFSWSRRYFHRVSNAIRLLISTGQAPNGGGRDTADGQLLLFENAWISRNPNYFVPYFNLFAGFGTPQSAARAADNVLVNTGINFESDALTGYPTLDASGKDAWGGAAGVNLLGPDFSWQWVMEFAWLQTHGNAANRQAVADQYAIGTRYQLPLNYAWILRMDAMHGFREDDNDITGARVELRWKF